MGGKGSGGFRSGAGRPRKNVVARALDGGASHAARVLSHPSAPPVAPAPAIEIDETKAPDDLSPDERNVWLKLFPKAVASGQLGIGDATDEGFKILCKNIVLERALRLTEAGGASHRGIQQAIRTDMLTFGLRPGSKAGAAVAVDEPAVNPMKEKYFGGR